MNSVVLRLSTTVYAEAYTYYTNDTTMVDIGDTDQDWWPLTPRTVPMNCID